MCYNVMLQLTLVARSKIYHVLFCSYTLYFVSKGVGDGHTSRLLYISCSPSYGNQLWLNYIYVPIIFDLP